MSVIISFINYFISPLFLVSTQLSGISAAFTKFINIKMMRINIHLVANASNVGQNSNTMKE